ncbi:hypothetical protein [Aromatoleum anaerobium]|uniref:hypothetical protein n=1 Tax=Aromatoleum anaerobium TaxID=182180 RepID=UPI001FF3CEA2|nr:hypothetical protein [Aromatoleum anaerobium]MCK0508453.1 hypothetical protein [Aromatoleum anaerobium]
MRIEPFDPAKIEAAKDKGREELRKAIDAATGTANREAAVYGTPAGGMLAFVMQSAVEDDVLDQVFATLDDSAARQFTRKRGALFWVALQGIDADQLPLSTTCVSQFCRRHARRFIVNQGNRSPARTRRCASFVLTLRQLI